MKKSFDVSSYIKYSAITNLNINFDFPSMTLNETKTAITNNITAHRRQPLIHLFYECKECSTPLSRCPKTFSSTAPTE